MPDKKDNLEWEKEFDNKFYELDEVHGEAKIISKRSEIGNYEDWYDLADVKSFIKNLLFQERQKVLEEIKAGRICLSCGKEKDQSLSDWCDKCLEEN